MKNRCFVVTPIGEEDSDERRTMITICALLGPICKRRKGLELYCAVDEANPGLITQQVLDSLQNDPLVVANLAGLNPNVMYEIGYRHATGKPLIVIAPKGTVLPFDIRQYRTIFYEDTIQGGAALKEAFTKCIDSITFPQFDTDLDEAQHAIEVLQSWFTKVIRVGNDSRPDYGSMTVMK